MLKKEPGYENMSRPKPPSRTSSNTQSPVMPQPNRRQIGWKARSQIVSMLIPSSLVPQRQDSVGLEERAELLPSLDPRPADESPLFHNDVFEIRMIFPGRYTVEKLTDAVNAPRQMQNGQLRDIVAITADQDTLVLALAELPFIFLLDPLSGGPKSDIKFSVKQLNLPGIGQLVPVELSISHQAKAIYIVGRVNLSIPMGARGRSPWVLAKFSLSGQLLARSRPYTYQRYSGLICDPVDGELLLTCPKLDEGDREGTNDAAVGQICKLTANFQRRIFSITVGSESAIYRPDYVTQASAGSYCWASVERRSRRGDMNDAKPTRRLFSFPSCQPGGSDETRTSPRNWLQVTSWDFAELSPGRITAYDAERLLVVDNSTGTLSYVTWPEGNEKPTLTRITRPGSKPIDLLCSNYVGQSNVSALAYLVSETSIYSFKFRDTQ